MKYIQQQFQRSYFLRLFQEEDILESLQKFCQKHPNIEAGTIQGIGAVSRAQIGFFDGRTYLKNFFEENLEILSLIGNIAENQVVHLHGIFGRKDGTTIGGHIFLGCKVSVTCEIQILVLTPKLSRKEDPRTKLKLLDLPNEIL
jgi:predicted DNA-binding protein with PD1-like motif